MSSQAAGGRSAALRKYGPVVGIAGSVISIAMLAAIGALTLVANNLGDLLSGGGPAVLVTAGAFGLLGGLVVARRPDNPMGWLMLLISLCSGGIGLADAYATVALFAHPGSLPGGDFAAWVGAWIWAPGLGLLATVLLLLFPDGRPLSPRWRLVVWTSVAAIATVLLSFAVGMWGVPGKVLLRGTPQPEPLYQATFEVGIVAAGACMVGGLISLVLRYRRGTVDERQQLKWVVAGAFVLALDAVLSFDFVPLPAIVLQSYLAVSVAVFPTTIAIAILRYRLYDIDLVISRTLVYGALAAFITAVYVGIVVGIGTLVGAAASPTWRSRSWPPRSSRWPSSRSGSAFRRSPTGSSTASGRRRTRCSRSSPSASPSRTPPMTCCPGWPACWRRAPAPTVPRSGSGRGRRCARRRSGRMRTAPRRPRVPGLCLWPATPCPRSPTRLGSSKSATRASCSALTVTKRQGESLTPVEEKLLDDLAGQAGLVLKNVGLTAELLQRLEDLRASRQRLVAAQDQERRRLERNLHDGAQQNLVALKVKLGLAEMLAEKDPAKAKELVGQLKSDANEALETLRDLARGIYPPLLADEGLVVALESQARKATVPVEVVWEGVGRYSQEIEAAVYFCVLEALQNVQKYAGANSASVRLAQVDGTLMVAVADDGSGFDPSTTKKGSGLQNMEDRLDALGGTVEVESAPGSGTTVTVRLPVREVALVGQGAG